MAKAVKASLKHYCSTLGRPQHEDCPKGPQSWCSFQRDQCTGLREHFAIKDPIPPAIQEIITPLFKKLGNERFLEGCKNVLTSNPNESFHHVLWSLAPKEQYTSSKEIKLAMNLAVCLYNSGFYSTYVQMINTCGLKSSKVSRNLFKVIDQTRIANADYKTLQSTKQKRKVERRQRNKSADSFRHDEGVQYGSGKFYGETK